MAGGFALSVLLFLGSLLAVCFLEVLFAETDIFWSDFEVVVLVHDLESTLNRKSPWGSEHDRVILAG